MTTQQAIWFCLIFFFGALAALEISLAVKKTRQRELREIFPPEAWYGVGSDSRYEPTLRNAPAYVQGLLDANRIIEVERSMDWHDMPYSQIVKKRFRLAQIQVHARAREVIQRAERK